MITRRFFSHLRWGGSRSSSYTPYLGSLSREGATRLRLVRPPRRYNGTSAPDQTGARASRIISRLPRPLQKYATGLRNAPVSHVVAFLALHEITAVVPLLGLFGLFHYTDYVPVGYVTEHYGAYVGDGLRRFERYFRQKGWFGFGQEEEEEEEGVNAPDGDASPLDRWQSDGRYRAVVEVALAYAITKALLPIRILGSVWATPWFARVLGGVRNLVRPKR